MVTFKSGRPEYVAEPVPVPTGYVPFEGVPGSVVVIGFVTGVDVAGV